MGQPSDDTIAASDATDSDLTDLCRLYARHLVVDALSSDEPPEVDAALLAVVHAHRRLAARRAPGDSLIEVSGSGPQDDGLVVDVITDEMPFVVESLLAGLGRIEAKVRRVIHPTVMVLRNGLGELTGLPGSAVPGSPAVGRPRRGVDTRRAGPAPRRRGRRAGGGAAVGAA